MPQSLSFYFRPHKMTRSEMFDKIESLPPGRIKHQHSKIHQGKSVNYRTETYFIQGTRARFSDWAYSRPITIITLSKEKANRTAKAIENILENDLIQTKSVVYRVFRKP